MMHQLWFVFVAALVCAYLVVWLWRRRALRLGTGKSWRFYGTGAGAFAVRHIWIGRSLYRTHTLTLGTTGAGKSSYAGHLATQAVQSGSGLVVVDPHASLIDEVLRSTPQRLAERGVVLIWPGCGTRVVPWNPLTAFAPLTYAQVADLFVGACTRAWKLDPDRTPRILFTLRYAAWALSAAGWTPLELVPFLTDGDFREYIVKRAAVPEVTAWAQTFDDALEQTGSTLYRARLLETNPHLQRLVGLGVTDPVYRDSCWRDTGRRLAAPADLGGAIDGGTHLLVALPREAVGELQPLFAALILDTVASVVLRRKPNSSGIQTEFFLDEFSAYIPDSFGQLLAQVRKFRGTIHLYAQGSYQAPAALRDEILNNTAVKLYGITDHPGEAKAAASLTLQESSLFHALQERMFVLKVRGRAESIPLVTPTFHPRCSLLQASAIATQRTRTPTVAISQADEELAWRRQWIAEGGYRTSAAPIYLGETGPSQDSHRTGRSPREHTPKHRWDLPL